MEDDILKELEAAGMNKSQIMKCLETLKRNNSVYAKGGSGTYAPL
jgi:DNA-binding IclR family transcriptional regulator